MAIRVYLTLGGLSLAAWAALFAGVGTAAAGGAFCGPAAGSWALMLLAMMSPLIAGPLLHIDRHSLSRRRAIPLFVLGYGVVWIVVGPQLRPLAWAMVFLTPSAPYGGLALAAAVALVWQVSPAKQACLRGCGRRPNLAFSGFEADLHALSFGMGHAFWCVGACGPIMLLAENVEAGTGSAVAMPLAALFLLAERRGLKIPSRIGPAAGNRSG